MSGSRSSWPPREIGRIEGSRPGPLLICVGGVHGNEPGGVHAAERFLQRFGDGQRSVGRGRMVFLVGNRAAIAQGQRYIDVDLNRMWGDNPAPGAPTAHEQTERAELLAAIEVHRQDGPWESIVLLDMHSMSGSGPPFVILGDTLSNRMLAEVLPIPVLLGIEERIDGTLLAEFGRRGERAICVEGGVNNAEQTVDALDATLTVLANRLGVVPAGEAQLDRSLDVLRQLSQEAPGWSRLSGMYEIEADEQFTMLPGFQSFVRVKAGQLLAHGGRDGKCQILAPKDALLVMPRYQGQGSDGFFLAEELGSWWRPFSRTLRRAGLRRLVPGLYEQVDECGAVLVTPQALSAPRRRLLALLGFHVADSSNGEIRLRRRLDPVFDELPRTPSTAGASQSSGMSGKKRTSGAS